MRSVNYAQAWDMLPWVQFKPYVRRIAAALKNNSLYRYAGYNGFTKQLISNNECYFATCKEFNDPFDNQITDRGNYTDDEIRAFLRKNKMPESQIKQLLLNHAKNPSEIANIIEAAAESTTRKIGILSLAQEPDNLLMWAHYANKHRGIVLGFNLLEDLEFFNGLSRMNYEEKYPEKRFLKNQNEKDSLFTKSLHWEYEKEWRILKQNSGTLTFNPKMISLIIMGISMSKADKEHLISLLSVEQYKHVNLFQAKRAAYKFGVEFEKLER